MASTVKSPTTQRLTSHHPRPAATFSRAKQTRAHNRNSLHCLESNEPIIQILPGTALSRARSIGSRVRVRRRRNSQAVTRRRRGRAGEMASEEMTATEVAALLDLKPHPEGGFYTETFRDGSITLTTSQLPPHCTYMRDSPL